MSLYKELDNFQQAELKRKKNKVLYNENKFEGFTVEDIEAFQNIMYQTHELAMQKFLHHNSESDGDILIDSLLAIRDMENYKKELIISRYKSL
ncbi:MAG: hypothetical protein EAX96_17355 [Candidatus Lokiarchaeota archaeon]|nr:hypothetical protein [Candidatus Lokiarchaeota archaeon]